MSDSHWTEQEQWLAEQGAHVKGVRSLQSISSMPLSLHNYHNDESLTAMQAHYRHWEEPVYNVEVRGSTVKQWQAIDKRMGWTAGKGINNSWGDPDRWLAQWRRHQQLLDQNEMYRQAWIEFQSIRALIGEATDWP